MHFHRSPELIFVASGDIELIVRNRHFLLKKGTAALILPCEPHSYRTKEHSEIHIFIFSEDYAPDFVSAVSGKYSPCPIFCPDNARDISNIEKNDINRFETKSALYHVLGQFYRNCSLEDNEAGNRDMLERLVVYVQENFRKGITLKSTAAALGYQYRYLSACIKNSLGVSFSDFINFYRVEAATELLKQKDLSCMTVAERCGYFTVRSFNRNFTEIKGMTPSEYRKTLTSK